MRIGIAGYGQMGALIRQTALARGHLVPTVIDPQSNAEEVTAKELTCLSPPLDVIIDFTSPQAAVKNIERYGELKVSAVIGTTGWYEQMEQVASIVEESGIGLIWSSNFSLGVNLFFRLVETAASMMNRFPQYDLFVHESHHRRKVDSPSGTAKMIGDILLDKLDRKKTILNELPDRQLEDHELHLSSSRGGAIPGNHRVIFDSEVDTIVLEHNARSRCGFAEGAVRAAEWIYGRSGLYDINDFMNSIIGGVDDQ
ncbi:MAG: 4-hydroxy-tetrahydrodipicolinate reductase [Dethiobacteria bacterium]|jgi:4-hydroxy-tetrahydrodipicolinate reductase|nr:4-hydroxy-tetrahydrodipicolinate reductase [Bacillota bacterium]NMD32741.1 4-hydroxy-tetrahydrodipicolinate reductase [Bacillota bacterium]HOB29271.1 4-hydroxy-tetrahydrodipicolinate reductase [Bacillota bacterium]HPZ41879.1 4-hydroxy-tetrahydrodipicolinate reductase [Bacillota bacterium]HQD52752.1 4-hydroxy-tetrahydrodipicolinate reductase [Bacillota bacterium]